MVYFTAVRRYQLRDGQRLLGSSMEQILAKACLPMKDWHKPEGSDRWPYVEAMVIGGAKIFALADLIYGGFIGW